MKNLYTIKTVLKIIGIQDGRQISIIQICVIISFTFLLVNCMTAVGLNWPDHSKRYTSIKDLNIIVTLFVIYVDFTVSNREVYELQRLVDEGLFPYRNGFKPRNGDKISGKNSSDIKYINKLIFYFSLSVVLTVTIVPLFITLYYVTIIRGYIEGDNEIGANYSSAANITVRDLPSPITTYYPTGYATVQLYALNYVFQAVSYLVLLHGTGYCAYIVAFDTTNNVANEIQLLCECLNNADEIMSSGCEHNIDDEIMKAYMRNIVDHHAVIVKKVKLTEVGLRVNTSAFSHALVVQLCMSIYTLVEAEDISLIIENFVTSVTVLLNLFMSYNQAQHIIDKSDKLRHCIFHSSWASKPSWFRKSVLIMSTCANKQLKIHPYGIYVMNRSTFSKVINLSYSYYNLMKSVKRS